ncbi:MAG: SDR family oxidoreductase [Vicinamibacteria bacterium]
MKGRSKRVRILVTGGGGFIGSHLVERIAREGHPVRVLDNFSTGRESNLEGIGGDIEVIKGDIRDEKTVRRAVRDIGFVYHEAALPSVARSVEAPEESNAVNIDGTLRLLVAAKEAGLRRFVYASSSSVYGDSPSLPKSEDMTPGPLSPYAVQKLVGEYYCRVFSLIYGLETLSLRYFNIFGPRQDPDSEYSAVIARFLRDALSGRAATIHGDGEQSRDFTYVENVVEANWAALAVKRTAGEVLNIACGERISVKDLYERVKKVTGSRAEAVHGPARSGDVRHSLASIDQARAFLGYRPLVGLEEGLRRTKEWMRDLTPSRAPRS